MNSAKQLLKAVLEDLNNLGIGDEDESVDGADAVDYLNRLKTDLEAFLKERK